MRDGTYVRILGRNGGSFSQAGFARTVQEHLQGVGGHERLADGQSLHYVPMSNSVYDVQSQTQYDAHVRAQAQTFEGIPANPTLEIMAHWDGYARWGVLDGYRDPSAILYHTGKKGSKVHMRPLAAEFVLGKLVSALPPHSLLLCVGWNATEVGEEFQSQLGTINAFRHLGLIGSGHCGRHAPDSDSESSNAPDSDSGWVESSDSAS